MSNAVNYGLSFSYSHRLRRDPCVAAGQKWVDVDYPYKLAGFFYKRAVKDVIGFTKLTTVLYMHIKMTISEKIETG